MLKNYPIIIIGMHRSGTSLITQLLEELGLFVGKEKDSNNESLMFVHLNNWLLRQAGATWDNPLPFKYLLENTTLRSLAVQYLSDFLNSRQIYSYIDKNTLNGKNNLQQLDFPWGWKDPRNTFTLPFWFDIFPNAKTINVVRNGVDVAQSLKVRAIKDLQRVERKWKEGKYDISRRQKKKITLRDLKCSVRSYDLSLGLDLWDEYLSIASSYKSLSDDQFIEVKYEEFLATPIETLNKLCDFCGLNVSSEQINIAVEKINAGRRFAYEANDELKTFAKQHKKILEKHGY